MKQIAHILAKDVRHLWFPLALWLVVVAADAALAGSGLTARRSPFALDFVVEAVATLAPIVRIVLVCILVPLVVHADPLVGTEAFWLTRPISRRVLLAAKLVFVALFVLLPPLVAELATLAANGVTPRDLVLALPEVAVEQAALVATVLVVASLTPGFARFALAGAAAFALLALASFGAFALVMSAEDPNQSPFIRVFDPSTAMAASLATVLVGGAVVAHQYATRRTRRSLLLALAGLAGIEAAALFWPWSFAGEPAGVPGSFDPRLAIDPTRTWISDAPRYRAGTGARKTVAARLEIRDLPPGHVPGVEQVRSTLLFADGTAVRSRGWRAGVRREIDPGKTPLLRALEHVAAPARLFAPEGFANDWPVMVEIDDALFARRRKDEGSLSAEIDLAVGRMEIVAEMPLVRGARYDEGSFHLIVADVLRRSDGCTVTLRESRPNLIFARTGLPEAHYLLRNRRRSEAFYGAGGSWGRQGSIVEVAFRSLHAEHKLDIHYVDLQFPAEGQGG